MADNLKELQISGEFVKNLIKKPALSGQVNKYKQKSNRCKDKSGSILFARKK